MGIKLKYDELHLENFVQDEDTGWDDQPPTAQQLDEMAQWYEENSIDAEVESELYDEDIPDAYFNNYQ